MKSFQRYSDLAVDGNGDILILYECGRKEMYDNIVLARVKFLWEQENEKVEGCFRIADAFSKEHSNGKLWNLDSETAQTA